MRILLIFCLIMQLEETYNDIVEALQLAKVHLYFLPGYSLELDAAEFAFHEIKRKVKKHKNGEERLWIDIMLACIEISHETMFGFYLKALYGWTKGFM